MAYSIRVNRNEATAARRRVPFICWQVDDPNLAATSEAGGQPQVSIDGAAWTNTGIGTLVAVGNGRYYAELTQAVTDVADAVICTRYKSATTIEFPGATVLIDSRVEAVYASLAPVGTTITEATLGTDGLALGRVMPYGVVTVYLASVPVYQFEADADGDFSYTLPVGSVWTLIARKPEYGDTTAEVSTVVAVS